MARGARPLHRRVPDRGARQREERYVPSVPVARRPLGGAAPGDAEGRAGPRCRRREQLVTRVRQCVVLARLAVGRDVPDHLGRRIRDPRALH